MLWTCWRVFRIVIAALVLLPTPLSGALADPKSNLVVILDGSGSMWGRAGQEPKIVAAKQVLREVLQGVSSDVAVGFVAYGHRRKGDCTDIETIAPLGSDPLAVASLAQKVVPRGRTPITEAMRQAATLFGDYDRPSTMVLVSDGIETCKGDPCALAKELKAQGVNLIIHTVGFGVADNAARQLQCIAEAGDGNYYQANDRSALSDALFAVREAVTGNQPAPKPKALEPVTTSTKQVLVVGPGTIKLKPASWVKMPPYRWQAVDPETGENKATARGPTQLKIRKGEYQIVWRQSEHYSTDVPLSTIVTVPAGKTVEVPIDTGLQIVVPEGFKPPYHWSLSHPGEDQPFASFRNTLDPQVLPAGQYLLGWRQSEHYSPSLDLGPVEIKPGVLNTYILETGIRFVKADWVPGEPYLISLATPDGTPAGAWKDTRAPQIVAPGTYTVTYRQSEHYHSDISLGEVTVLDKGFAAVTINSGVKFTPQSDAKPPYQAIFVDLDSGQELVWKGRGRGKWEPIPLPPGRYRLDWWEDEHGSERMTLIDEFELEAGSLIEMQM